MKLRKRNYPGTLSAEGIVLLENDGVLPLQAGARIALYGFGARYTIKGGTGSGSVNNRSNVSIDEGLRNSGFIITTDDWLSDYDRRYQEAREEWEASIYRIAGGHGGRQRTGGCPQRAGKSQRQTDRHLGQCLRGLSGQ